MGVLYILDEPSIGLHQRDNDKLIATLKRLRDLGNTAHRGGTRRGYHAGSGLHRGHRPGCRRPRRRMWWRRYGAEDIMACPGSVTGQYLSGVKKIEVPAQRRPGNGKFLTIRGARENNLKNVDVKIPLGCFTVVTGVSGSGKSSLINEILYKSLAARAQSAPRPVPASTRIFWVWSSWTRSSTSTSPPSDGPPVPTRQPTPACSPTSGRCSPRPTTPRCAATIRPVLLQCQGRTVRGL